MTEKLKKIITINRASRNCELLSRDYNKISTIHVIPLPEEKSKKEGMKKKKIMFENFPFFLQKNLFGSLYLFMPGPLIKHWSPNVLTA